MALPLRKLRTGLPVLGCFGGGSLYGWSGYLPAVSDHFAVDNAAASMVFSLALMSFTLGVLLAPLLLSRIAQRFRLPLLAGLGVLWLGCAGGSDGFAAFVIAYGLCFGFTSGVLYNHAVSVASGTASATFLVPVSVAAFGLGGAVFGPLQVWLTAAGLGLWSVLPALICLGLVAALALLTEPMVQVDSGKPVKPTPILRPDRKIGLLGLIFAAGSCSGLIVLGLAAQILPSGAEGVGPASLAVFLAATGNTLGRLSSSWSVGRFGPTRGIAGALVLSMGTLAALMLTTDTRIFVALLFLVAFAYGQIAATMPLLVRSQVAGPAFSGTFGWVFIGWGVAGLVGPWGAGWLLDSTGTIRFSLVLCIALSALSLWLVLKFDGRNQAEDVH